jgi:hypothetical protein
MALYADSASSTAAELRDYLERGRPHKNLNLEQMQGLFKRIFISLAQLTSLRTMFIKLHDLQAEYTLRRVKPPYDLVRDEAEQFISAVQQGQAMLDAEG